jgi:hypothetical protein
VDGGIDGKGKKALAHMNPLCTCATRPPTSTSTTWSTGWMRWMPTSKSWSSRSRWRRPRCKGQQQAYVKLLAVSNKRGVITASIEVDRENAPAWCGAKDHHRAGRLRPGAGNRPPAVRQCAHWRNPHGQGRPVHGAESAGQRGVPARGRCLGRCGCERRAARNDPPHDQGTPGQGKAPAPAWA